MRESPLRYATRQAAALALAGVLAAPLLAATPHTSGPPGFASLTGMARVIDGDTLAIGEIRVRLEGIDAPESSQTCAREEGGAWDCGRAATAHLSRLVAGREVRCEHKGVDRYGRMLGQCFAGETEINGRMVRDGLAWAFVRYSLAYVGVEAQARDERIGIWRGPAEPAWEYRARRWPNAGSEAASGCAIKGNVSRNGRIYHMPWDPYYGRTRIDENRGERWFCTEDEALAAGWRAAGRAH